MRDLVKTEEYFQQCIQDEKDRIDKFSNILNSLDSDNILGINRGKNFLANFYRNLFKMEFSIGEPVENIIDYYVLCLKYYKDVCTPNDSMYDIIDMISIGVLLDSAKAQFISFLEEIVKRFNFYDGIILFLMSYLKDVPFQRTNSVLRYFNEILDSKEKEKILCEELGNWYQEHKDAYWYNSHQSKNDTYCGYWCFEVAAISKIFKIEDSQLRKSQYYPYDLVHYK